ncbi:MAG: hypothetical protein KQH63_14535 [Desulfobulbaceae bacterium]|nr:hypothetical protein [Desulfobulbaceae bacterium]
MTQSWDKKAGADWGKASAGKPAGKAENDWFNNRRDFFVTRMLKAFYKTSCIFGEIYQQYLNASELAYADIDRLVGSEKSKGWLWRLKDDCHQLWRDADPESELNGCLLDWSLGSVFHEAMKLKENVYLYQFYGPLAQHMKSGWQGEMQKFCGVECQRFMERISLEMNRQMENMGFLFGRTNYLLRSMLPSQAKNNLLLRYLVEHEEVVRELWFESLDEIFADMYQGAPEMGFCNAAKSYYAGNWDHKAHMAYNEALRINSECLEAREGRLQVTKSIM